VALGSVGMGQEGSEFARSRRVFMQQCLAEHRQAMTNMRPASHQQQCYHGQVALIGRADTPLTKTR
jgi:hypothetical protein